MPDTRIDFGAPAELRKWPSVNKQRVSASLGARPYLIGEGGTLALQLPFMQVSESMGNHDSKIVDAASVD
jgi:hypothetical protein